MVLKSLESHEKFNNMERVITLIVFKQAGKA
jgi:hypothetical protein